VKDQVIERKVQELPLVGRHLPPAVLWKQWKSARHFLLGDFRSAEEISFRFGGEGPRPMIGGSHHGWRLCGLRANASSEFPAKIVVALIKREKRPR